MREIDLKPTEYRLKGGRGYRPRLSKRALVRLAVAAGIWAACSIAIGRTFFDGRHLLWVIAVTYAPIIGVFAYAILTDDDRPGDD